MIAADAQRLHFESIDSTSEEARRRAASGQFGPLWITADAQTAGRGRRGRAWVSPPGNLFATYLGSTRQPAQQAALLSFAAALAVADTFAHFAPEAQLQLKWPNDVLLGGGKSAGILLESGQAEAGQLWFALGLGLNLVAAPKDVAYATAALADIIPPPTPDIAFARLCACLADWSQRLEQDGFATLRAAWLGRAARLGETIRVEAGASRLEGTFTDLSPDGALVLALPGGEKRLIHAGDVFFEAEP